MSLPAHSPSVVKCSQRGCLNDAAFLGSWLAGQRGVNREKFMAYGYWEQRPVCADCCAADAKQPPPHHIEPLPERVEAWKQASEKAARQFQAVMQRDENRLPGILSASNEAEPDASLTRSGAPKGANSDRL